jgi:hypothetical protein
VALVTVTFEVVDAGAERRLREAGGEVRVLGRSPGA